MIFKIKGCSDFLQRISLALVSILIVSGCGGSGEGRGCGDSCVLAPPPPVEIWWDVPLPDFSENIDRPTVTLLGSRTELLTLGDDYLETGATALDEQDGDISSQISISGQVDSNTIGDYVMRYSVTDNSGLHAIEKIRIVRVTTATSEKISRRPLGSTIANFGYLEHLPLDYGHETEQKPPLIIYLHGSGGNAQFASTTDPTLALDSIIQNYGIPKLIDDNKWDNTLPFVVLAPLLGAVPSTEYKERIDAFVEFAIRAYDIDSTRIYITGWSNGGYIAYEYAINFPEKIAAVIPVSSGLPYDLDDLPNYFCGIEQVPVWMFHGDQDDVLPYKGSVNAYHATLDNCQPILIPKVSLLLDGKHDIHHSIFDLSALDGGSENAEYDSRYSSYDSSVYQWLLSHSTTDRQL
jgi:predicted esterase